MLVAATTVRDYARLGRAALVSLDLRQKILAFLGLSAAIVLASLFFAFHGSLIRWLATASVKFREVRFNWLIIFMLNVLVSFPPVIGYSALSLFTGMVFGFRKGWILLASGTLVGSTLSFLMYRHLLRSRAETLARRNVKFMALVETLRQDSIVLLWMIRLCPLPYSFSNAAMSTIPSVETWKFVVTTLCATPKLLLHIFVGVQVAKLSNDGDAKKWWANLFSILLAVTMGAITSYVIYHRTMAKAAALEQHRSSTDDSIDDFEIDERA